MPNLHPLVVHFPIALLLASVALEWASWNLKNQGLDQAAWYALLLGLLGAAFAVVSGFLAAASVPANSPAFATLNLHRVLGIVTLLVFGALTVWRWRSRGTFARNQRVAFALAQIVGVALIVALGFMGGELVYTFGIGVTAR